MEIEQLAKRIEWLDEERRKDKITIDTLKERIASLESSIPPINQQVTDVSGDLARFSAQLSRFDQQEAATAQLKVEVLRKIDEIEKARSDYVREMEKVRLADLESLRKGTAEVRKGLEPITELKAGLQSRIQEEFRLNRLIDELTQKLIESQRGDEDYKRSLKLLDEGHRQDNKRLTDLQGEVGALRKRLDEQRGRVDVTSESTRKVEIRLNELLAAESERRQAQTAFIEKQTMWQVERDRVWKEMQAKFEDITRTSVNLDTQIQSLDSTQRSVKRSQEAFDEITQRFERRINELTEMQRLVEDRFRQEWVGFKADDQKRWTNYSLAQEETQLDLARQFEKFNERLVVLEDTAQELRDALLQVTEDTQKRLQSLVGMARQWAEEYERNFGRPSR